LTKKIPIDKIDFGIIESLKNSRRILKASEILYEAKHKVGDYTVIEIDSKYAVILYYYALEELGKAIKLEDEKSKAKENNQNSIDVDSWFLKHDIKLDYAIAKHGKGLHISKVKWEKGRGNFFIGKTDGPLIKKFQERSNLWLTDYNEQKESWQKPIDQFIDDDLEKKIPQVNQILDYWQEKYRKIRKN